MIKTYRISKDRKSITCLGCGFVSYHPKDIENHYCGHCHLFHDDLWPPAREWFIGQNKQPTKG